MPKKLVFILLLYQCFSFAQTANDCSNAVVVCGNSTIASNASGFGIQEIPAGTSCLVRGENNSLWLQLNIAVSGDLAFVLSPESPSLNVDYDFAIFAPNESCGNFSTPIRCSSTNPISAGQTSNTTGLSTTETDLTEGPGADGNGFVSAIPVQAGETYFLLIDRPIGDGGFSLEWTGTSEFFEPPVFNPPTDIELCIADEDTTVDLSAVSISITTDPTAIVEFYTSFANAFDRDNAVTDLANFPVMAAEVPLFARVQGLNDCFEILDFSIISENYIDQDFDTVNCDQDGNGREGFDLDAIANTIFNALNNPTAYNITFHLDEISADNSTGQIVGTPFETGAITIYARIALATDPSCFVSVPVFLDIVLSPIPISSQLIQCDIDPTNSTDGFSALNLNQVFLNIPDIEDFDFFFYETIADRDADNPIPNPIGYINTIPFNQTLFYRATNTIIGCENLGDLQIQIQPTTVSLNNQSPFRSCDINPNDAVLEGIFDLEAIRTENYPGLEAALYATLEDATLETNPLSGDFTTTSTTVFARLENSNQCQGVEEIQLEVVPTPVFILNDTFFLCTNDPPLTISGPPGFDTYRWLRNVNGTEELIETAQMVNITELGSYTLEVGFVYDLDRTPFVCTNSASFQVLPSNNATIQEIEVSDVSDIQDNNTIAVSVSGEGDYEFSIDGQNYQDSPFFENVPAGFITVFVRDKRGCGISEELVSVIGYPRFFTPNGDNVNDFWQILGANEIFQPNTSIHIFDRYGKLLQQLRPGDQGWDGKFNARELPSSDYWFKVNLEDGREFTGHFTLKR
ncbi:T9SS type B sorting domain-containing protein [Spongiimicrobium salis]|uniref:T9SS type B sorting domain-containing protein n=1 Tax=Spongiimicrobium salis TaxID=1667022 RepID=UPI00374DBDDE